MFYIVIFCFFILSFYYNFKLYPMKLCHKNINLKKIKDKIKKNRQKKNMASYCNAYMNIKSYGKKPSSFSSLYYFYHPHYITSRISS